MQDHSVVVEAKLNVKRQERLQNKTDDPVRRFFIRQIAVGFPLERNPAKNMSMIGVLCSGLSLFC